jgi:hypothetical protein
VQAQEADLRSFELQEVLVLTRKPLAQEAVAGGAELQKFVFVDCLRGPVEAVQIVIERAAVEEGSVYSLAGLALP